MPTKEPGSEPLLKNKPQIEQPKLIELQVGSVEELTSLLDDHNIDHSQWRKTPADLSKEIKEGETIMKDRGGQLERHVSTVLLKIISPDGTQQLVEDRQEFKNFEGDEPRVVRRDMSELAEKFKAGEDPEKVALRAIKEELLNGEEYDESSIKLNILQNPKNSEAPQSAYAGLTTVNNLNRFLVRLPQELYREEGYIEKQPKKTNFMVWKDIKEV